MEIRMNINWLYKWGLRVITAVSLVLGLFWTSGIIIDETQKQDLLHPLLLLALSTILVGVFLLAICSAWPNVLKLPLSVSLGRLLSRLIGYTLAAYILLIPVAGTLGHVLVRLSWANPHHSQSTLFQVAVALWLPIWWSPSLGAVAVWAKLSKKNVQEKFQPE
jgi:hypothetical protein